MFNKGPESPEYAAARDKMNSFTIQTAQMEKSINSMTSRIKSIAASYTAFGQKLFSSWISEAPPAVAQADECAQKNAAMFENLIDTLINQTGPQFFNLLTLHDAQIKELQALDRKRTNAQKESLRKESALNSAKNQKEPVEEKIQQAQTQYDQAKSEFEQAETQFINEVKNFEDKRNVKLTEAFQNYMGMFCQFLNQASLLQPIDFPEDINGDVVAPPTPQQRPLPPSNPASVPVQTPQPAPASVPVQTPQPAPVQPQAQAYNPPQQDYYNPPPAEPAVQPQNTYDDAAYSQTNNTYNDYNNNGYNNNDYNNNTYDNNDYNNNTYNDYNNYNAQQTNPNTTPSYAYDAPANDAQQQQQPAQDPHQTKNPFDEDDDGWGANPFG